MEHRRIPSLNWLRVFEAAARTQSFSRAADVLLRRLLVRVIVSTGGASLRPLVLALSA